MSAQKDLIARLLKARTQQVQAGGHAFVIRPPTQAELLERQGGFSVLEMVRQFVTDWPGMTEIDLGLPGGTAEPVPFTRDLWIAWIDDHADLWMPLGDAILALHKQRQDAQEADAKN